MLLEVSDSFDPTSGNFLGLIEVYDNMHIEMDIELHSFVANHTWNGVMECISGLNGAYRYPGIWIDTRNEELFVFIEGNSQWVGEALVVGESIHLEVDFTQTSFTVTQDGVVVYKDKTTHNSGINARCWAWTRSTMTTIPTADVTISNLLITTSGMPFTFCISVRERS